jgi:AraC family transcriptional regulator, regulatory protein of adaptative response / methylated-DNA-[protein]-cysteine methyltransferase
MPNPKSSKLKDLLNLTLEVGLSSPGRLHDLFVTLEAMSPGEFKAGGAGLQICYGIHDTPFGQALIATTARGICNLHFLDATAEQTAEQILRQSWTKAEIIYNPQATQPLHAIIFDPSISSAQKSLTVLVKGTNFQVQVWRALLSVPFGGLTTYQTMAEMIGRPKATRAVGTAIGHNPIGYLIPCHRVIRASGEFSGYRWGLERKTVLLGWEASRMSCER